VRLKGKVWKYGANVDTDAIIPARYLNVSDGKELAKHCMEDIDTAFASEVQPGDIIVATTNFGCGSSREHAPLAIKESGVSCVIASSYARIFYRNAINIGLPILECDVAAEKVQKGDLLEVDLTTGRIDNLSKGESYQAKPYPDFMLKLINAGGLINMVKEQVKEQVKGRLKNRT